MMHGKLCSPCIVVDNDDDDDDADDDHDDDEEDDDIMLSSTTYRYCLVKGSPEAIKHLLIPGSEPSWYSQTYETLARRGLRVLALAFKRVSSSPSSSSDTMAAFINSGRSPQDQPRSWVESDLLFGGFIAFECKIRADSGIVMRALIQADHKVSGWVDGWIDR